MSVPSAANGGIRQPDSGAGPQSAEKAPGKFNEQHVEVVGSRSNKEGEVHEMDSSQIASWKSNPEIGVSSAEATASRTVELQDAARSAGKKGLLQLLRAAVRAVIDFFVRGLNPPAPAESLEAQFTRSVISNLADSGSKAGSAIKRIGDPQAAPTLADIRQAIKELNLPDNRSAHRLENPRIAQLLTERADAYKQNQLRADFHRAGKALAKVYDTSFGTQKAQAAGPEAGRAFAQIVEDTLREDAKQDDASFGKRPGRELRDWLTQALSLVENCSQAMADTSVGKLAEPALMRKIEADLQTFTGRPAD